MYPVITITGVWILLADKVPGKLNVASMVYSYLRPSRDFYSHKVMPALERFLYFIKWYTYVCTYTLPVKQLRLAY